MSDDPSIEVPESRDLIRPEEAHLHTFGADCPCHPERLDVTLEGDRPGVVWKHGHLDGPPATGPTPGGAG